MVLGPPWITKTLDAQAPYVQRSTICAYFKSSLGTNAMEITITQFYLGDNDRLKKNLIHVQHKHTFENIFNTKLVRSIQATGKLARPLYQ